MTVVILPSSSIHCQFYNPNYQNYLLFKWLVTKVVCIVILWVLHDLHLTSSEPGSLVNGIFNKYYKNRIRSTWTLISVKIIKLG